jgi:hypothetical protein
MRRRELLDDLKKLREELTLTTREKSRFPPLKADRVRDSVSNNHYRRHRTVQAAWTKSAASGATGRADYTVY